MYDRSARFYDLMEAPMDRMGGADRRRRVLSRAEGRTDILRPITRRLVGPEINRRMEEDLRKAGLGRGSVLRPGPESRDATRPR